MLFGGTAVVSFAVRPIDASTGEDYRRLEGACDSTDKGAICRIEGPARLTLRAKEAEVVEDIHAGEYPTVEMRKSSLYCREG